MELSKRELEAILARQADRVTKESDKRMKRYIGGLKEDFDGKFDTVMEYVVEIPALKEKQDMMFEKMGEMAENITIIKETVKDHEVRLQRLEMQ